MLAYRLAMLWLISDRKTLMKTLYCWYLVYHKFPFHYYLFLLASLLLTCIFITDAIKLIARRVFIVQSINVVSYVVRFSRGRYTASQTWMLTVSECSRRQKFWLTCSTKSFSRNRILFLIKPPSITITQWY